MSRVAVLFPRIDLPFKEFKGLDLSNFVLPPEQGSVRQFWAQFLDVLEEAFKVCGIEYQVYQLPMWEITEDYVVGLKEQFVFVPHKISDEVSVSGKTCIYYMQVMTRWLFSVDVQGWSAACSKYPCNDYRESSPNPEVYKKYIDYIVDRGESKFSQTERSSYIALLLKRRLPFGKYIFFPCQIPHDQSIQYFSDFEELDVIRSLCDWAEIEKVNIVFKRHPANLKSMKIFEPLVGSCKYASWSDANINDLIRHSAAVYTINSGVGFEALLHNKPVVTFGRVEYDVVTLKATTNNLAEVWNKLRGVNHKAQLKEYCRFFNWYCSEFAVDLRQENSHQLNNLKGKFKAIGIC